MRKSISLVVALALTGLALGGAPATASATIRRLSVSEARHTLAARERAWDIHGCRRLSNVSVLCQYRQAAVSVGIETEDPHAYYSTANTVERLPDGRVVIQ